MSQPDAAATPTPRPRLGSVLMIGTLLFIVGAFVALGPGVAWDMMFINPLINSLLLLTNAVAGQFGVAIILFTVDPVAGSFVKVTK